jgi:hypothetical protein
MMKEEMREIMDHLFELVRPDSRDKSSRAVYIAIFGLKSGQNNGHFFQSDVPGARMNEMW